MKVFIGPYKNWLGPYQIADFLQKVGLTEDECHEIGKFLDTKTPLGKICNFIYERLERKKEIVIHDYDTWNMDATLAYIILPMLKQLKETAHGSPMTDNEPYMPAKLRINYRSKKDKDNWNDSNIHARWQWILDEIIWAFEQIVKTANGDDDDALITNTQLYRAHHDRIVRGTTMFGKYYRGLWD